MRLQPIGASLKHFCSELSSGTATGDAADGVVFLVPSACRKRHATHNSSSTSSSSDDECRFERRKARSMVRARNRCLPLNFQEKDLFEGVRRDRAKIGTSLADVDPMQVDQDVKFDHVGGLDSHIQQLKEMILFPLIYPEVFERFKISPPRGVLFYGPPGTGKTLVARALANECSHGDSRVAFFMRKGADCLSKWVGESERQLRLLFDQVSGMDAEGRQSLHQSCPIGTSCKAPHGPQVSKPISHLPWASSLAGHLSTQS